MNIPTRWENVQFKYEDPPEEIIISQLQELETVVKQFCDASNVDFKKIKINLAALIDVVIRTDMRRLYFSIFHNNMKPNEYKLIVGLIVFWIIKRHPFWLETDESDDEETIKLASQINEKIALYLTVTLLQEYNSDFFENGKDLMKSYTTELLYSFTYRDLSKESLFLMFDPFYYTYYYNESFKNGNTLL